MPTTTDGTEPYEFLRGDPLRDASRSERRSLLVVSLVTIALVLGHVSAPKLVVGGVEINVENQPFFFNLLFCVIAYFLTAFSFYAVSDYSLFFYVYVGAKQSSDAATVAAFKKMFIEQFYARRTMTPDEAARFEPRSSFSAYLSFGVRFLIDTVVPLALGGWALVLAWKAHAVLPLLPSYPLWIFRGVTPALKP